MGCCPPDPDQRRAGRDNLHAVLQPARPFSIRHATIAAAAALLLGEKIPRASSSKHTKTGTQPPILHRQANSPQVSTYTLLPPNARPAPRQLLLHTYIILVLSKKDGNEWTLMN
jgi:hypothetical protein